MQVSVNGTSKEVIQFLLGLSGQIAGVLPNPSAVVTEVVRIPAATRLSVGQVAHMHPDQIRDALADAGTVAINGAVVKAAPEATPEAEKTEPVDPYPNGVPNPADAPKEPAPEPTAKPKARKSRLAPIVPVAGEAKPDAVAGEAKPDAAVGEVKPDAAVGEVKPEPVAAAKPEPVAETKPEPATEPATTGAAPAEGDGVDCPLPPTWEAWSLPKKIMWATMRSAGETATLLKQFGFADKIGPVNAENLFQVRRKLEIAMRMEAQA